MNNFFNCKTTRAHHFDIASVYNTLEFLSIVKILKSSNPLMVAKLFLLSLSLFLRFLFIHHFSLQFRKFEIERTRMQSRNTCRCDACIENFVIYCHWVLYREWERERANRVLITSTHRWRAPIIIKSICVRMNFLTLFSLTIPLLYNFWAFNLW